MNIFNIKTMTGDSFMFISYGVTTLCLLMAIICLFKPRLGRFIKLNAARINKVCEESSPMIYLGEDGLSPVSTRLLEQVTKKTLVLDMDQTLITSWVSRKGRHRKPPSNVPHDFKFVLSCATYKVDVYVYKRPHVDLFLNKVSKWYNLVVFTCGTKDYASPILDYLDKGRGIFKQRLYRQDTIDVAGLRAKYISLCSPDMANVLLLDNSKVECSFNAGNCINIPSYWIGRKDEALIDMLPFLDGLRFTKDVRSMLAKCTRFNCLTTLLESLAK